jgi:hypothetical protein
VRCSDRGPTTSHPCLQWCCFFSGEAVTASVRAGGCTRWGLIADPGDLYHFTTLVLHIVHHLDFIVLRGVPITSPSRGGAGHGRVSMLTMRIISLTAQWQPCWATRGGRYADSGTCLAPRRGRGDLLPPWSNLCIARRTSGDAQSWHAVLASTRASW